jgi:hypothetical protein
VQRGWGWGWACDVLQNRLLPTCGSVVLLQVTSSSNWRGKGFQATPTLPRGPSSGTTPNTNSQGTHRNLGGNQMTLPSLHAFAGTARVSRPEQLSNTHDPWWLLMRAAKLATTRRYAVRLRQTPFRKIHVLSSVPAAMCNIEQGLYLFLSGNF